MLLAFGAGGSGPRCPRCPSGACWGRRETRPGLSSGLPSRAWPCLFQAPEEIWTRRWGYGAGWAGASGLRSLQPRKGLAPSLGSQNRREKGTPPGPQRQALQRAKIKEIRNNQPPLTGLRGGFYSVIYVKALRNFVMVPCKCRVIKVIIIFTIIVKSPSRQGLQSPSCSSGHLTDGKTEVWDLR